MGDHLVKIVRGASSIQGKQVYVLMEDGRMGVHHNVKDLSRNLGNILTVGTWKARPSCPASFFMVWEQQVRCCLRQPYKSEAPAFVPRPEGSGGKRRPGKFNKSVPSSSTPFRVSFPWALDLNARCVREARGTSWLGRSRGLPKMPRRVAGRGRDHRPPHPHQPSHLHWTWYFPWDFSKYFLMDSQTPVSLFAPKKATSGRPFGGRGRFHLWLCLVLLDCLAIQPQEMVHLLGPRAPSQLTQWKGEFF